MSSDVDPEVMDKGVKAFKVWENNFGQARAEVIMMKVASASFIKEHTLLELINVGKKWHYANLFFNGKISKEDFTKELKNL